MPKRNVVWIILAVVLAALLFWVPDVLLKREKLLDEFGPLIQVNALVEKLYVEPTDSDELVRGAIDGMLGRLDQYTQYFDAEQLENFEKHTEGRYQGIGIEIGKQETGELVVISPIEGSPAFDAGLQAGDQITEIDGQPTLKLKLGECARLIQGEPGTYVTLTILRSGTGKILKKEIVRSTVHMQSIRGWARDTQWNWQYMIDPVYRIGYVRLSSFEEVTTEQLDKVIRKLLAHRMQGLIIDVRNNPGGQLDTVVDIANRFLTEGIIVSIKYRATTERIYQANADMTFPQFPMAILVNEHSASASEILSGALRDHGRAVLVGTKTFGKGSVQEVIPIQGTGGALKLTTARYYLPNGECIHGKGVMPDEVVTLTPEQVESMQESWQRVSRSRPPVATTQSTTEPGRTQPTTQPSDGHGFAESPEIAIDAQLETALEVLRSKLIE